MAANNLAAAQLMAAAHPLLLQHQLAAAAQQQQQLRAAPAGAPAMDAAAKKTTAKKRKPLDKAAVEKPLALIPESPLFNSLVLQEQRLDGLIKRRRLEIQAALHPYECAVPKRLRVYIYSTHSHQQQQQQQQQQQPAGQPGAPQEPPQWTLWVWGRLIDAEPPQPPPAAAAAAAAANGAAAKGAAAPPAAAAAPAAGPPAPPTGAAAAVGADASAAGDAANAPCTTPAAAAAEKAAADGAAPEAAAPAAPAPPALDASTLPPQPSALQLQQHLGHKYPMTGFFERIAIQLDAQQYPGPEGRIAWDKAQHRGPHKERLEVKRLGSQRVAVTLTFDQHFVPPAYKLDARLVEVLGMSVAQLQSVLTRAYSYILAAVPQSDLSLLQLDDKLAAVLGTQQLPATELPQALSKLLQPLAPVVVQHTIDPAGSSPGPATCVDFDVLLPMKLQDKLGLPALDQVLEHKQLGSWEGRVTTSLMKLFEARRRRMMYLGFADNPVGYLGAMVTGQAREMRVNGAHMVEVERKSELFSERWVDEAAARYLGRKTKPELFPALGQQGQQQ